MNLNKVLLIGRMATKPEKRFVTKANGDKVSVTSFVFVNNTILGKDGDKYREESMFISCEAWDSGADRLAELDKGTKLLLEGTLRQDNWEDKTTGKKVSKHKVRVEKFQQLFDNPNKKVKAETSDEANLVTADAAPANDGEDIPF